MAALQAIAGLQRTQLPHSAPAQRRRPPSAAAPLLRSQRCQQQQHGLGWRVAQQQLEFRKSAGSRRTLQVAAQAAAAPAAAAAAQAFWPALVQAWNVNPAAVMLGAGACILGVALSVFLLASIPTMLAVRRSAHAMEGLLRVLAAEVPDTAATLRLSGLELADCIQELGGLGTDLTDGVRASARAVANAEAGIRQGAYMAGQALAEHVIPNARDRVESALQERAKLEYTREVLQSTKDAAQRLRFALAAGGLASGLLRTARYLRPRRGPQAGGGGGGGGVGSGRRGRQAVGSMNGSSDHFVGA